MLVEYKNARSANNALSGLSVDAIVETHGDTQSLLVMDIGEVKDTIWEMLNETFVCLNETEGHVQLDALRRDLQQLTNDYARVTELVLDGTRYLYFLPDTK